MELKKEENEHDGVKRKQRMEMINLAMTLKRNRREMKVMAAVPILTLKKELNNIRRILSKSAIMKLKIAERNLKLSMERQNKRLTVWFAATQPRVLDNTDDLHAWQPSHEVTM